MTLYKLLLASDRLSSASEVISLTGNGAIGEKIQALGVPVRALGMSSGGTSPFALLRLARWLRRSSPAVIQTWMYHADLIGGVAAKLAAGPPVAWGIRHSDLNPKSSKRSTIWTVRTCARLSRWLPAHIVCCSEASLRVHGELGYAVEKMRVIPNGFDLNAFKPDEGARISVRRELGIADEAPLIGLVARFDPQKDHRTFVEAAAKLNARRPDVHFLLCGNGISRDNVELAGWIDAVGLTNRCHLLGLRDDVPRLVAALDVASSSSSYGEGFPNVVGEAMACAVPCAVTDVGDSALIVKDTGRVVPARNPGALAAAWLEVFGMSEDGRRRLGAAARQRVRDHFDLSRIARCYEDLYGEMGLTVSPT